MGGGKISKEDIVAALGYEPVGGQGVNLLRDTIAFNDYVKTNGTNIVIGDDGVGIINWEQNPQFLWRDCYMVENVAPYSLIRNKKVTFSFFIRSDDAESFNQSNELVKSSILLVSADHRQCKTSSTYFVKQLSTDWTKIVNIVNITDSYFDSAWAECDYDTALFGIYMQTHTHYSLQITRPKIELGDVEDPIWTPAPEDTLSAIAALTKRVATLETKA